MPVELNQDITHFVIRQDFGSALGIGWTDAEATTEAEVVRDIISGQHERILQVVAFNTAEGWSRDLTEDVARAILNEFPAYTPIPRHLIDFIGAHTDYCPPVSTSAADRLEAAE